MSDEIDRIIAMDKRPDGIREIAFHIDRLNAWMHTLWAAESLDLRMCDGAIRKDQFGLLQDIRLDVMALRAAFLETAFDLPFDGAPVPPSDEKQETK